MYVASRGSLASTLAASRYQRNEAMDSEGPAQVVQVGRAVVVALLTSLRAVDAQMLQHLAKILADPIAVISFPLRQLEEKRTAGRRSPQGGA